MAENLTDSELRKKLKEYGHSVGPITNTTRKILKNKLDKLISHIDSFVETDPKKKSVSIRRSSTTLLSPSRRSSTSRSKKFAPFSSDEDEGDVVSKRSIEASAIVLPEHNYSSNNGESTKLLRRSPSRRKTVTLTPTVKTSNDISRTSQQILNNTENHSSFVSSKKIEKSTLHSFKDFNGDFSSDDDQFQKRTDNSTPNRHTTLNNKSIFSPQSRYTNNKVNSSEIKTPPRIFEINERIRNEVDASLAKIRNSFSSKRPSPPNSRSYTKYSNINPDLDEEDEENEDEELEAEFPANASIFEICDKSMIILKLILVVIFFGIILFGLVLYKDEIILPGITEVKGGEMEKKVGAFIQCLHLELSLKKGLADCGYKVNESMAKSEMGQIASLCFGEVDVRLKKIVEDVWNKVSVRKYADFFQLHGDMVVSKISRKPLFCRISQALSTILFRILITITLILLGIGLYFYIKKKWSAADEETRQILYFVHKIVDTVRKHASVSMLNKDIPPFLPIPHVRDMLIPLAKRKGMAKTWQKAVAFLHASDSRIRVETQRIAGEDYEVWRWIGVQQYGNTASTIRKEKTKDLHLSREHGKCWQGPAFDEIEKVVRLPIVTPAPCLKIRHMHDGPEERDDNWTTVVRDAVLEKCDIDGAKVLHVFVDAASKEGCVYVKCDSLESAGKAFRSMYGNWFNGHLIIVKFVTLTRYHQRFPDALRNTMPLKLSATSPSSLSWTAV